MVSPHGTRGNTTAAGAISPSPLLPDNRRSDDGLVPPPPPPIASVHARLCLLPAASVHARSRLLPVAFGPAWNGERKGAPAITISEEITRHITASAGRNAGGSTWVVRCGEGTLSARAVVGGCGRPHLTSRGDTCLTLVPVDPTGLKKAQQSSAPPHRDAGARASMAAGTLAHHLRGRAPSSHGGGGCAERPKRAALLPCRAWRELVEMRGALSTGEVF